MRAISIPLSLLLLFSGAAWANDQAAAAGEPAPASDQTVTAAPSPSVADGPASASTSAADAIPTVPAADTPASPAPEPPKTPVVVPDALIDQSQPIGVGVTGWVPTWPAYNHHLIASLAVPVVTLPWQLLIDAIPTLGTGSAGVGYPFLCGPVMIQPVLGLRYYGVTGATADAFLYGPQGRVGLSLPILPWLSATGKLAYAPWLLSMNKPGAGSFVEFSAALAAHVGRMTYSLGYMGLVVDPTNAGLWPVKPAFLGGPTGGVGFSF